MMFVVVVLVATSVVTLLITGYLVGARRGRSARAVLLEDWETRGAKIERLEASLAASPKPARENVRSEIEGALAPLLASAHKDPNVELLRREMHYLMDAVTTREHNHDAFRQEVRGLLSTLANKSPDADNVRRDLQKMMAPLLAGRNDEGAGLRQVMQEVLAPLLEREHVGRDLSSIHVETGGLGELPKLLDAIAEKAAFATVVLSDESGLPLAASSGAADVDGLAGTAAFFVTLSERAERAADPRPLSCVILDESNRLTLHRMFAVGSSRFTLSAVSRGTNLAPGALDPALSPLERALTRRELS